MVGIILKILNFNCLNGFLIVNEITTKSNGKNGTIRTYYTELHSESIYRKKWFYITFKFNTTATSITYPTSELLSPPNDRIFRNS